MVKYIVIAEHQVVEEARFIIDVPDDFDKWDVRDEAYDYIFDELNWDGDSEINVIDIVDGRTGDSIV